MKYLKSMLFGFITFFIVEFAGFLYPLFILKIDLNTGVIIYLSVKVGILGGALTSLFPRLYSEIPTRSIYTKSIIYYVTIDLVLLILTKLRDLRAVLSLSSLVGVLFFGVASLLFAFLNKKYNTVITKQ